MKTEVIETQGPEFSFPLVAEALNSGTIVLFSNPTEGTVIHAPGKKAVELKVGVHLTDFTSVINEKVWRILDAVTIQFKNNSIQIK